MPRADTKSTPTGRVHRACANCRRKKVRCDGEQPTCRFCARLGQECRYKLRDMHERRTDISLIARSHLTQPQSSYHSLSSRISQIEAQLKSLNARPELQAGTPQHLTRNEASLEYQQDTLLSDDQISDFTAEAEIGHSTEVVDVPPLFIQLKAIDAYFRYCHNHPYCFFHEETFRARFAMGILPEYLIYAVMSISLRFVRDVNWDLVAMAEKYAGKAWKRVISLSFDHNGCPNYRLVQATILLAIFDFTACRHGTAWLKIGLAVSLSQALQMTDEPSMSLSCAAREERRRTFWSIYLLDKMATCGRRRPSLFIDRNCSLQLPSSESAFRSSTEELVPSLEELKTAEDLSLYSIGSFTRQILVASILSEVARYVLHQTKHQGQKPPWDHNSEYPAICTQLNRLENMFDHFQPIQARLQATSPGTLDECAPATDTFIFSYIIYQLCYCLLHHPFLLRRSCDKSTTKIPPSFLAQALNSCKTHAHELVSTLSIAQQAGFELSASFYGYCLLIAGTIHCLFQHSSDAEIQQESVRALDLTLGLIASKAKLWANSACMEAALKQFVAESHSYSLLIDPSRQNTPLAAANLEWLLPLLDYGTMSELGKFGAPDEELEIPTVQSLQYCPTYNIQHPTNQPNLMDLQSWT